MKPAATSHDRDGHPVQSTNPYRLTDRVLHAAGITAALLTGAVAIVLWWPR
jgi:hypothetical protein